MTILIRTENGSNFTVAQYLQRAGFKIQEIGANGSGSFVSVKGSIVEVSTALRNKKIPIKSGQMHGKNQYRCTITDIPAFGDQPVK
jgi:hypothetical protein